MESCLLCLELNKELLDSIEINSNRWEELGITKVLEKHFWPLNSIQHRCSWICSLCWQELHNFHKFYLRIEEAHMNFGKIKLEMTDQLQESKKDVAEEIKDLSYYLEPEILIDQIEMKSVLDIPECSIKEEGGSDLIDEDIISKDPLTKPIVSKRRHSKQPRGKPSVTTRLAHNAKLPEIKKEVKDSDDNDDEIATNEDDDISYEPEKNKKVYKSRKEVDKFIAEHFKQMFCDLCDVQFEGFNDMKKHYLMVHSIQEGYLVCCTRKFYRRNHLVDHLNFHLNPDHFKCDQCGKILSDRKNLKAHMLRVHRPEGADAKHPCEICGKSFIMAHVLKTHKLKHLPKEEKKFPCTECGKFYASSYLLKIHTEVVHLKKQAKVCYICGITLSTSTEYKAHMNKHEGIPVPVINCDVCGLRLTSERGLKLHKESQHPVGGKKDHPCPLCDKVSPTPRALKKHVRTMHEKGYDHKCSLCEKAFRRTDKLKEHMASHTGTPLYTCPWCPKTFNSNGNMHAHRKNNHPKEYLELKLQKYN